jgi:L-glutamine-phosphate cytidylyltransferase
MRAIILVAGRGSRLPNYLSKIPKSLITLVTKKTLIEYLLDNFKKNNIKKIALITGYKKNLFKKFKVKKFNNKNWKTTNMVSSLLKADKWLSRSSCIISYGDIFYSMKNIKKFLNSKKDISILYDTNWKKYWKERFSDPLDDAETFKINKDNSISEIGKKTRNYSDIMGQYMGVIKFSPKGWTKFKKVINEFPKKNKKKIFMTDVLNKIAELKYKFYGYKYSDNWFEIDSFNDYVIANKYLKCISK